MILALLPLIAFADAAPVSGGSAECPNRNANEVVVCGSRRGESPYRLPKLPERYDAKRIRAETKVIAGVNARAHVDAVDMPDGNRSNRVMVTFSMPF